MVPVKLNKFQQNVKKERKQKRLPPDEGDSRYMYIYNKV